MCLGQDADLHLAQLMPLPLLSLAPINPDWFYLPGWPSTIGRAIDTVCHLSVICLLSVTFYIVAKWYIVAKNCLKEQIGLPPRLPHCINSDPPPFQP